MQWKLQSVIWRNSFKDEHDDVVVVYRTIAMHAVKKKVVSFIKIFSGETFYLKDP